MKKDDIIELTIEDLGIDGEGIGKADGMAIFVKDAVVGDRIQAKIMKMKKHYGFIYIDRDNDGKGSLKSSKKKSFNRYKEVIASNGASVE